MAKVFIDKYPTLTFEYDGFIDEHCFFIIPY